MARFAGRINVSVWGVLRSAQSFKVIAPGGGAGEGANESGEGIVRRRPLRRGAGVPHVGSWRGFFRSPVAPRRRGAEAQEKR